MGGTFSINGNIFNIVHQKVLYTSYYNKKKKELFVNYGNQNVEKSGFIDDIDGFLNFHLKNMNSKDEAIGVIQAMDAVSWFENNSGKVENLSSKLQKLKDVSEDDNPVIQIIHLN